MATHANEAYDNGFVRSFTAYGPALHQVVCEECGCLVEAHYWRAHRAKCPDLSTTLKKAKP